MERLWGISLQLYELRSSRNWGIGDFADLAEMIRLAHSLGADFVGLNPLHVLFPSDRRYTSPYSPSDRRFLDPIYIDVSALPHLPDHPAVRAALAEQAPAFTQARVTTAVDYAAVWTAKEAVLRAGFTYQGVGR